MKAPGIAYSLTPAGHVTEYTGAVSLEEAQRVVGGWVQLLTTMDGAQVLCNEEGKLKGLPRNDKATALVQGIGLMPDDYIAGTVIVLIGARRWS